MSDSGLRVTAAPRSAPRAGTFYPPYLPRTGKHARKRVFAWLSVSRRHNAMTVRDEHGDYYQFSLSEYEALRDAALSHGWCLFAHFSSSAQKFPHLRSAVHDECATILATGGRIRRSASITGIAWKRGRQHAEVIDPDTWGWSQLVHEGKYVHLAEFLGAVRSFCNAVGTGDYDTPQAIGKATLEAGWYTDSHLRRLWILPARCRRLIRENPVHPRIYDISTPARYALLRERDLRAAYATMVGANLPLGQPCYVTAAETTPDVVRGAAHQSQPSLAVSKTGICLGLWAITVPETLTYGPVCRVWAPGQSASFCVGAGRYEVPLWGEEADALAECGCTCTWLGGYLWLEVGKPFVHFLRTFRGLRAYGEQTDNDYFQEFAKRVPNATIGGFNRTDSVTILPEDQAVEGDLLFPLEWDGVSIPDELVALHIEEREICSLEHWYSYIVMRVGLQIWEACRIEIAHGLHVTSCNIDSYRVVQPTLDFTPLQDTRHWKEFLIRDAKVTATRHIDGMKSTDGGLTWQRMIRAPGVRRT